MRSKMIGLLALLAATLFAASAFAGGSVEVDINSQPVPANSPCEKAGGYTLTFGPQATIVNGDTITFDLQRGVTLCHDVDLYAPFAFGGMSVDPTTGVYNVGANGITAGEGYFRITGTDGTARLTIEAVLTTSVAVGADATDALVLNILSGTQTTGIDSDLIATTALDTENVRCIAVDDSDTVRDNIDSNADQFTFSDSNPQVAHIVDPVTPAVYAFGPFCGADKDLHALGNIELGVHYEQANDTCDAFDNETLAGYCVNTHNHNELMITSTMDIPADYRVTLNVLAPGVEFSSQSPVYDTYATHDLACAGTIDHDSAVSATGSVAPVVAGADSCELTVDATTVAFVLAEAGQANERVLQIDLPAFNYNLATVVPGSDVMVQVVIEAPAASSNVCSAGTWITVFDGEFNVGTLGCDETVSTDQSEISFPYFTEIESSSFWAGFVIVNKSDVDGVAQVTGYERDGDKFTASIPVAAHSMSVELTTWFAVPGNATLLTGGTLGDSQFYLDVEANFEADGFAMMAVDATGSSMGYLPRVDVRN